MAEFKRKNSYNFWHSPIALIALFCLVILFMYNIIGLAKKEAETAKKKKLILAQIETLRSREENLSRDIEKLKTEQGIEETIRDKYQVVKEGEKMVVIIDDEENKSEIKELPKENSFWTWLSNLTK